MDSFNKARVSSGESKALLTKKRTIFAVIMAIVIIGGLPLILTGCGGGGNISNDIVGRWESNVPEWILEFSSNGTYVLTQVSDGSITEQGSWRISYDSGLSLYSITYYNRYAPNAYWQPNFDSGGWVELDGNTLSVASPISSSQQGWTRSR